MLYLIVGTIVMYGYNEHLSLSLSCSFSLPATTMLELTITRLFTVINHVLTHTHTHTHTLTYYATLQSQKVMCEQKTHTVPHRICYKVSVYCVYSLGYIEGNVRYTDNTIKSND